MKKTDINGYKYARLLFFISLVITFLCLFIGYKASLILLVIFAVILAVSAFVAGIRNVLKKHRAGYFYIGAWIIVIAGTFLFSLMGLGVLPVNFFTKWSMQIGIILQAVLFSYVLSDQINSMKKELSVFNKDLEKEAKFLFSKPGGRLSQDFSDLIPNPSPPGEGGPDKKSPAIHEAY